MKTAEYPQVDGSILKVDYDPDAPCWACGLPVIAASMGGTVLCSWCDCGRNRDGSKWMWADLERTSKNWERSEAAGHWVPLDAALEEPEK